MKTFIAALRIKYPLLVNVFTWTFGLLLALALLAGRYKWTPEASNFSWRSYLMSAFMLVITLPTFYYLLKIFIKRTLWAQLIFFLGLYTLILFQTWMHLSMRSPAVYVSHFVAPVERASWYHGYLFPNAKGAVNLEYPAWRVLEENFMGVSQPMSERMLPRSFTF